MFQKCDKCGKGIGFNEAYVAITYSLQKQTQNLATQENVIDIDHSEIVMVFCGNCGNKHNAHVMSKAIQLEQVVYQQVTSNAQAPTEADTTVNISSPSKKQGEL